MRTWTDDVKLGKRMSLQGWVHDIRILGGISFLILRDGHGTIQVTAPKGKVPENIVSELQKLHQEDLIEVEGQAVKSRAKNVAVEVIPESIKVLARSETPLPLDPRRVTKAHMDTRLNWRVLDLRTPENLAIFKIQSKLIEGMEEYLRREGFMQVFTPSLLGGTSEGGSEVFPVVYFEKQAFLRQDPQLHRELLIAAGFEKIFDMGPSWRAEQSHTIRHMTEHRTIAPEVAFIKDEYDVMVVEQGMVANALKKVKAECAVQLELLKKEITVPKLPFPVVEFPQVYGILEEMGKKIPAGEDYDRESEALLAKYVMEKHKSEFFFVNRFPYAVKPFYVMAIEGTPWARSTDLEFKGMELSSGGQRENRYDVLIRQLKEKRMNVESMKWFTDFFKYGVPTMGGFSIGIERFTQQLLDLENIREATLFPRDPERLLP